MTRQFTTADFFAGIGGTRIGFQNAGFRTVFANEIDDFACQTYEANFHDSPKGDITKLNASDVPDHDVLLAGFPCQSFSIAGRKLGFEDTRGTLFFDVARILKEKRPSAFLLENVKNLKGHDHGKTFKVIENTIRNDLEYSFFYKILNAKDFGLPQNRERIIMVGFRKDLDVQSFEFPTSDGRGKKLKDILEKNVPLNFFISKIRYLGMERHRKRHEAKGHGFGYRILDPNGISGAIVVGGMGRERNLVKDEESFKKMKSAPDFKDKDEHAIRYLTPREYARLQGFPDSFEIPVSNAQAYKQFANSVPINLIEAVAVKIKKMLETKSSLI